jgi:type I restriction enzyme S subunit
MKHTQINLDDVLEMRFESHEIEEYKLEQGDLLICEGGEPGRCAIWEHSDIQMMCQKALHRVRPFGGVLPKYLLYHIWTDAGNGFLNQYFTGATIRHFTGKNLSRYIVALPPLAEQKRIVAKVEALLALCDALAAGVVKAEEVRARLLQAVLNGEGEHHG